MALRLARASRLSSGEDDIDPEFLRNTQQFLECRSRHWAPGRRLTEAWEQFYRTYDPHIRRFALACGTPGPDLDDCVQEVWATLVARLRNFSYAPCRCRFRSWLYTLVHSKAADLARSRASHPVERLTPRAEAALDSRAPGPAAEYERHRQQALVHELLEKLRGKVSERSYRVLYQHWFEGRTIPEIAAALDLTPEQVWLTHHRTRRKLRRLFEVCAEDRLAEREADQLA